MPGNYQVGRLLPAPVMPGLEPGIQAAPSVIIMRTSALDARVEPVHDETKATTRNKGFIAAGGSV